jgi:hypothetical protein
MEHIYHLSQFGENWFASLSKDLIKKAIELTPSGGKFVEIGSWKGKSSAFTVVEIINSGKNIQFDCIDTWRGSLEHQGYDCLDILFEIFQENMKPLVGYYNAIKMKSMEAVNLYEDNSLDFIFIDASHEYEDVKADIVSWMPKLKERGIIGGDDYNNTSFPGIKKAVEEVFNQDFKCKDITWFYSKNLDIVI